MKTLSNFLKPAALATLVGLAGLAAITPASARDNDNSRANNRDGYSQSDRGRDSDRTVADRGRDDRRGWDDARGRDDDRGWDNRRDDWRGDEWRRGDGHRWRDAREARRYWAWRHKHSRHYGWH